MFGQLFPSLPQFRGRQVVTLHNQRDFLFFRRHRYAFASPTEAKLQEIGPRFTLKLRWMRKGLPGVKAADGRMPSGGDKGADTEFAVDDSDDEDAAQQEEDDEAEAAAAMARGEIAPGGQAIPALDEEQEYEWKWKVSAGAGTPLTLSAQDGGVPTNLLPVDCLHTYHDSVRIVASYVGPFMHRSPPRTMVDVRRVATWRPCSWVERGVSGLRATLVFAASSVSIVRWPRLEPGRAASSDNHPTRVLHPDRVHI